MRIILILLLALASSHAAARWELSIPDIEASDMEMISKAVSIGLEGRPVGTTVSWDNEDSGNHGTVKLLKSFTMNERECRRIRYFFTANDTSKWQLDVDFCRDIHNLWQRQPKLVDFTQEK